MDSNTVLICAVIGMVIGFFLPFGKKTPEPKRTTLRKNGDSLKVYRFEVNLSRGIRRPRNKKT